MSSIGHDPESFYLEGIPAQFNRELCEHAAAAQAGDLAEALHRSMAAVNASMVVKICGPEAATFNLNVERGQMTPGSRPTQPLLFTLEHDRASFAAIREASGSSVLGFLGGLAGHSNALRLTSQRVENLTRLRGAFRFELTGEGRFELIVRFGECPAEGEPDASLVMSTDLYRQLARGELDAQDAFFSGGIQVDGDMELAIQLALAALAPDL